jgi:quercetin dioxygenase-like cupin family protein
MNWGGKERRESSLPALRALTETLPTLTSLTERKNCKWKEYFVASGYNVNFSVMDEKNISVCRGFFAKNTMFPPHQHQGIVEYLICFEGKYKVTGLSTGDLVLEKGDCAKIASGELHGGEALEQTWLLAITIPPDEGFPHGS